MTGIGIKVSVPFLNNQTGSSKLNDLKSHMLGWYDVKRQGCTNDSLAENPVLEDLSGNNHPLELKNFAFGGLSGIGSYGTDLTKWINYHCVTCIDSNKVQFPFSTLLNGYDFRTQAFSTNQYFKAKCSVDGSWVVNTNLEKRVICSVLAGEVADVYCDLSLLSSGYTRIWLYFQPTDMQDYILEILPNFPNSLVFNGVTPEYVINKDNVTLSKYTTAIGLNKFKVTRYDFRAISYYITGKAGEPLTVSIPSFIVRITGLETKKSSVYIYYKDSTGNSTNIYIRGDGTYIVPAINYTLDAKEDGSAIKEEAIRILIDHIPGDVTLEFLPNYPAPTTKMYGIIPTITQGAKCMMMDFVPTFPINHDGYISYYTQRQSQAGSKYALMTNMGGLTAIAYNDYNSNGTYINGQYNNTLKHVDLLNKRQVVSVNTDEVYEMPANRGIVISADESLTDYFPTMALNSLILFDRELTEEEMKLVMNKLMKYEDTDNIAGDLSRSANVLSLDDSGMYEEYDVYEDEQEIIEAPTEFNDNTV